MADQLATPEDLAALLQQDLDRATAELLIECATAVVQEACGQRIVRAQSTVQLDGDRSQWLVLPQLPVISVDAVSLDGAALTDWQLRGHQVHRPLGWFGLDSPLSTVEVTYTHGYAADDQALQLARTVVLSLAATVYSNPAAARSERIGDYAISFAAAHEQAAAQMAATPFLRTALLRQYGRSAALITLG